MDISNAFKEDVFRALVITFIPGAFSIAPYIVFAYINYSQLSHLINNNLIGFAIVYSIIAIASGMILEDLGSRIEAAMGKMKSKNDARYDFEWDNYLCTYYEQKPIIFNYISGVVMRMKFELSFAVALVIMGVGLVIIAYDNYHQYRTEFTLALLFTTILIYYLVSEAYTSVELLGKLRDKLSEGIYVVGLDGSD
ncbi:MAG: hypothetical protein AB2601_19955 [Candidatus Thiodiazotropha sp.]